MPSDDKISKFFIMFTIVIFTFAFVIPSQIMTFSSVLATSSNSNEGDESNTNESSNEENDTATFISDENQQQQVSDIDEESNNENSINDNDQSPTEPRDTATASSQGLTLQNHNQIQPNTLSGNIGVQERPRDNAVLTSSNSTNTLDPIKPDPNLDNSPGNLNVVLKVECKSINGLPSDRAVCDTFTKEPEFIKPKDYSLTLDITRNGANSKSTFPGDSEGQTFTIKPGDFEVNVALHRDAYDVVAKKGGYSQLNGVHFTSSATGDCYIVNLPLGNVYGELLVKGIIHPLTDSKCTINVQVNYNNIELPKSSFGDMLQNQRMPDAVIQN